MSSLTSLGCIIPTGAQNALFQYISVSPILVGAQNAPLQQRLGELSFNRRSEGHISAGAQNAKFQQGAIVD